MRSCEHTATSNKTVEVWDLASGKKVQTLRGHTAAVLAVSFAPDGRSVLSAGEDHHAALWDVASGTLLRKFLGHTGPVNCARFSPDGLSAVTGSDDGAVKIWNVANGRELNSDTLWYVRSSIFSPDGKFVVAGLLNYSYLQVWDAESNRRLRQMMAGHPGASVMTMSPDARWLIVGYASEIVGDNCPFEWDLGRPSELLSLEEKMVDIRRRLAADPHDAVALTTLGRWYAINDEDAWATRAFDEAVRAGAKVSSVMRARSAWRAAAEGAQPRVRYLQAADGHFKHALEAKEAPRLYLMLCLKAVEAEAGISRFLWSLPATAPEQ